MSNYVLLYNNFSDQGLFSGGSWALPLTNLQDADIAKVARSTDAQTTSTIIKVDLGRIQLVDGVAVGPVNMSPGATWRFRGYNDAAYTSLFYDSGLQTNSGSVINWSDVNAWLEWEDPDFWYGIVGSQDNLPQYLFHITPAARAAQYWKIELFDSGNFDGHLDIGRLLICQAFRPSLNYDENNSFTLLPLTDVQETLGGKRVYFERGVRRTLSCAFTLDESEIFGEVFSVGLRSGVSRQVFVVPEPSDTVSGSRRSFLATLKTAPIMKQLNVARGSTVVDLEEVL